MRNFIIIALCALVVVLLFKNCGLQTDRVITKTDTITVVKTDTIRYTDVVYKDRWRNRTDTVIHIEKGDTIRVPIPIDTQVYTDDSTYRAVISGYKVSLDKMDVYSRTVTVEGGDSICINPKVYNNGSSVDTADLSSINFIGGLMQFIGVPYGNKTKWIAMNYKYTS